MIITPKNATDYPKIIKSIKYNFSKNYTPIEYVEQSQSREKRGLKAVWQKRYYEHTIRNQKDWVEKMQYIQYNPIKHNLVKNINDWKYSSFA